jgi:hypothetical protein
MMGTEMVPETQAICMQLAPLIAREYFIKIQKFGSKITKPCSVRLC